MNIHSLPIIFDEGDNQEEQETLNRSSINSPVVTINDEKNLTNIVLKARRISNGGLQARKSWLSRAHISLARANYERRSTILSRGKHLYLRILSSSFFIYSNEFDSIELYIALVH
uniref:Uncharacterized protein n=1 Tax=Parascaris univalens TaxID=6257 RepID=A0A915AJV6_PARUN